MHNSLIALIELAATNQNGGNIDGEDLTVQERFPELVAPIMRYEMLMRKRTEDTIREHLSGLTKPDLIKCKTVFDRGYFINLTIPYSGIQTLCQELVKRCREFEVTPPSIWQKYADGVFDWETDIGYMETL